MDIGLFIIVLIVMYVIPEIMKRLKPRKPYQYPEFPSTLPQEQVPAGIPGELSRGMKPPPLVLMNGEGMPGDEGDPMWGIQAKPVITELGEFTDEREEHFHLGPNEAALGFIWAEIIAKPVALRPLRRGVRGF